MEALLSRPHPALALALIWGVPAAPLAAAPLCHDTKGLFTPCPRDSARRIVRTPVDHAAAAAREEEHRVVAKEKHERHVREHPNEPEKPALVARGKLCRDGKGLFTPCPR